MFFILKYIYISTQVCMISFKYDYYNYDYYSLFVCVRYYLNMIGESSKSKFYKIMWLLSQQLYLFPLIQSNTFLFDCFIIDDYKFICSDICQFYLKLLKHHITKRRHLDLLCYFSNIFIIISSSWIIYWIRFFISFIFKLFLNESKTYSYNLV